MLTAHKDQLLDAGWWVHDRIAGAGHTLLSTAWRFGAYLHRWESLFDGAEW